MAAKMMLFCIACVKINLCCDGENRHPEFAPVGGRFGRGFQYDRFCIKQRYVSIKTKRGGNIS